MTRSTYSTAGYQRERAAILADDPLCVHCGTNPADSADHQPPIALHSHVDGTECCVLVPSCMACQRTQAGQVSKLVGRMGAVEVAFEEPPPTPGALDPIWDGAPWLEEVRAEFVAGDVVWPRFMTLPSDRAVSTYGHDFIEWSRTCPWPVELRTFQKLLALRLLEVDVEGRLVWRRALWSMARQLGKTVFGRMLLLFCAEHHDRFGWEGDYELGVTSRRLTTSELILDPVIRWADGFRDEGWGSSKSKGYKHIELPNGMRVLSRAVGATPGLSLGAILNDETWDQDASEWNEGAAHTVTGTRGSQWFCSTAHSKAKSFVLNLRSDAFAEIEAPRRLLVVEWSAPRDAPLDDPAAIKAASPHFDDDRLEMALEAHTAAMRGHSMKEGEDPIDSYRSQILNQWPQRMVRRGRGENLVEASTLASALAATAEPVSGRIGSIEDSYGKNLSVVVAGIAANGRISIDSRSFDSRAEGWQYALELGQIDRWLIGASLGTEPKVREFSRTELRGTSNTRQGLSAIRSAMMEGRATHTGDPGFAEQMLACRVREAQTGLTIVSAGRHDAVKAAAWAVVEVQSSAGRRAMAF